MNTTTASDIGVRIARRLAADLGPRRYAMWFDKSARLDFEHEQHILTVAVPNRFVADWIGRHFHDNLRQAAEQEIGAAVTLDVRIVPERFAHQHQGEHDSPAADEAGGAETPPARRPAPPVRGRQTPANTHRLRGLRHRLEDFVVGPSNQLAYAAAQRLAEEPAEAGAPLFLHGTCGLGKTHLLQGICRRILEHHADARVLYTTGEQFTNDYITAVRSNKLDRFRRWIRQLDLLAVDDVHFIANKQATQQEFLHSFDQIELGGARVVLASDSHPKLIEQFSEALVSRCVRGLVVPIHPPDARTRARLVQVLAERRALDLAPEAARLLGQQSSGSVREIEGALTKLQALVALARQNGQRIVGPIDRALVQQLLDHDQAAAPRQAVRFETILDCVAEELGVNPSQVLGRGRHRLVVLARALTVHLARRLTSMSYPEIATALGRTNHSTVITAAQRMQRQLQDEATTTLPAHLAGETLPELVDRLAHRITRA
ncbi:MAG: chromosomal replication initiator protein DnaA [Phycisphaeraceae bacterium]